MRRRPNDPGEAPTGGPGTGPGLDALRFLASALAGAEMDVVLAQSGDRAWTDTRTIFLPPSATVPDRIRCLAVQASMVAAGSFAPEVMSVLRRRSERVERYLAIEARRALQGNREILPMAARALLPPTLADWSSSPAESLALALGGLAVDSPPEVFGQIRPQALRPLSGDGVSAEPVEHRQHLPRRQRGDGDLGDLDETLGEEPPAADLFSSPVGGGGGLGRVLKKLFADRRSPGGGPPGADAPTRRTRGGRRRSGAASLSIAAATVADVAMPGQGPPGCAYPEWDRHRAAYRPAWCTVREEEPSAEELTPFVVSGAAALRRPLARLGVELERASRRRQGDDIDIDATVEQRVDLAAGVPLDEAVYVDTLRRRRDLAILILLDISGSAGQPGGPGRAGQPGGPGSAGQPGRPVPAGQPGRPVPAGQRGWPVPTVHEMQRSVAGALLTALHDLGDRVALYGFRSQGRSAVTLVAVKRFGRPLDALVLERLGALVPAAYTRLGAAVRHATSLLEAEGGTSRRLMVVISDGLAYDHGYERSYGEADVRRALAEARRRGIGCLCLTVGADTGADALRRAFGTAAHAAIPHPELLPAVVGGLFGTALQRAERQRRAAQRRRRSAVRIDIERRSA